MLEKDWQKQGKELNLLMEKTLSVSGFYKEDDTLSLHCKLSLVYHLLINMIRHPWLADLCIII